MEEVDVAIVGAGLAGLATAVALHRVDRRLSIKVLECRPAPSVKYAGFVKLQPNGLKAAEAISPALTAALQRMGLPEKCTLLHGEDGRLVTRLDTREELMDTSPSGPNPWDELEEQLGGELETAWGGRRHHQHRPGFRIATAHDNSHHPHRLGGGPQHGEASGVVSEGGSRRGGDSSFVMERRRRLNMDESSPNIVVGWWELERLLTSMLPPHTVVYEASFLKYHETEGGVVALFEGVAYPLRCRLLLGADGPFSGVRAQCVQDSEPAYDRTVKWVGRLDGHHVSTTPLDFSAWWIKKGQVFVSHPLANGDIAWEALVSDRELQAAGFVFDENAGRVLPAGEEREIKEKGAAADIPPSQALAAIFASWPKSVVQMVTYAPPEAVLETGVFIRNAADMPPSMGKGRVAIVGEAAHPLRPTGQDPNMALEDAAELAAFVQEYGVSKEALRRYDVARRPRWRHVMQLTAAQGASTSTGIAVTPGFLKYTQDLYHREFTPLGRDALRAARKAARDEEGSSQLARLMSGAVAAVRAGLAVAAVLLASAVVLPATTDEPRLLDDAATSDRSLARRAAVGAGRLMARGGRRLVNAASAAGSQLSQGSQQVAVAADVATMPVRAATGYLGAKAEDATAAALGAVGTVATRTLSSHIAKALGAF